MIRTCFWLRLFVFYILGSTIVYGLRCKCTQNSNRIPCQDGVCDVESGNSACLTLDHPTSGRHYACSTSVLPEAQCVDKTSKSGLVVKVCSCGSNYDSTSEFCNYKLWPDRSSTRYDYELDNEPTNGVLALTNQCAILTSLFTSCVIIHFRYLFI
ncbi:hypothetical protein M3Y94_00441000 [Aphelenchoides besseyi]|nr:hypothetical protein M3Y94_00441000 [Aphelenchoides besseyi]